MKLILFILILLVAAAIYLLTKKVRMHGGGQKKDDPHEYEYAFMLDVTDEFPSPVSEDLRKKLQEAGAVKRLETVMPIAVYLHPNADKDDNDTPYIRVRHEGPHVAFTVKTDRAAKFVKEYEVNVEKPGGSAVDEMHKILSALSFPLKYRVEKLREIWDFAPTGENVEVVFDTYPGLPTYIEIEAHSKKVLDHATKLLGFDPKDHMSVRDVYSRVYGFPTDRKILPGAELTFNGDPKKQFEGMFKKNEPMFDELVKKQQKYIK
jgi:adenylate cyclase class IV